MYTDTISNRFAVAPMLDWRDNAIFKGLQMVVSY